MKSRIPLVYNESTSHSFDAVEQCSLGMFVRYLVVRCFFVRVASAMLLTCGVLLTRWLNVLTFHSLGSVVNSVALMSLLWRCALLGVAGVAGRMDCRKQWTCGVVLWANLHKFF